LTPKNNPDKKLIIETKNYHKERIMELSKYTTTMLLDAMMRQHPIWPSTFDTCCSDDTDVEHVPARGSGYCSKCLMRELHKRGASRDVLDRFQAALMGAGASHHQILDEITEKEDK
jgi:hypothetical protein